MFIDHVIIEVAGGRGGDGCVSFRREKFVPRGGPDGGDGGKGGDVTIVATSRLSTLVDVQDNRHYKAGRGMHGQGSSRTGRRGEGAVLEVPPGTIIKDVATGEQIGELLLDGDRFIAAHGGKGGHGNERFKSSRNRAPRKATPGKPGEQRKLEITLKLIADVGLVGEPNAGKSTLLSVVSAARPNIAPYPFTTKTPVLGIVKTGDFRSLVMVDIPGLIEGAHAGRGMGRDFLRHVERCRVLVFLIDVTHPDPVDSYDALRGELLKYDARLLERPSIVALTKCDLLADGGKSLPDELLKLHATVVPISSVTKQGLEQLNAAMMKALA